MWQNFGELKSSVKLKTRFEKSKNDHFNRIHRKGNENIRTIYKYQKKVLEKVESGK